MSLDLKRLKNKLDTKATIHNVELSPPLSYPIFQILVDESGDCLALIGKHMISVVEVRSRFLIVFIYVKEYSEELSLDYSKRPIRAFGEEASYVQVSPFVLSGVSNPSKRTPQSSTFRLVLLLNASDGLHSEGKPKPCRIRFSFSRRVIQSPN